MDQILEMKETTLFCVKYVGSNKAWAYASLLPILAAVFHAGEFWQSRNLGHAAVLIGFLVNEGINHIMKHHFQVARPPTCARLGVCSTYGFPSSHAQCILYLVTVRILMHIKGWRRVGRQAQSTGFVVATLLPEVCVLMCSAVVVPASRVVLGYHTFDQVLVGAACGTAFAVVWHTFTEACLSRFKSGQIERSALGTLFGINIQLLFQNRSPLPMPIAGAFKNE